MRRIVCFLIAFAAIAAARADFAVPDFAYPQTVISDAEPKLDDADGLTRLKAVMEIVAAKTAINPDSLNTMPQFISAWASKESEPGLRSLYLLYQATVAQMARREIQEQVPGLVDEALAGAADWGNQPLRDFREVLSVSDAALLFFPRLRDFVFSKSVDLCPSKSDEIYEQAIGLAPAGSPERAYWECCRADTEKDFLKLYEANNKGVAGAYILWMMRRYADRIDDYDAMLADYLRSNPTNSITPSLASLQWSRRAPTMTVFAPEAAAPGREFEVKIVHSYTSQVGVELYRVKKAYGAKPVKTKVAAYTAATDSAAVGDTTCLTITVAAPGNYELSGISPDIKPSYTPSMSMTVTDWIPFGAVVGDSFAVGVADFTSGAPVAGVTATLAQNNKSKEKALKAATASDGFARMTANKDKKGQSDGGMITLSKGADRVEYSEWLSRSTWQPSGTEIQGAVFVSRPLYHPGDTVGWTAVMAEKNFSRYTSRLAQGTPVTVVLQDANYQGVDTVSAIADEWGRVSGDFAIPTDRLAGRYRINVMSGRRYICSASLMVSDFKLPVFEVTGLRVSRNDSCYVVEGRAVRFSGAAVPDASVEITLSQARLWWWAWGGGEYIAPIMAQGVTEADGSFTVEVPVSQAIPENGLNFECVAEVTSVNADIASATTFFRVGKPYMLAGSLLKGEVDGAKPVELRLTTVDTDLKFSPLELQWILKKDKETAYTGKCVSDSLGVKLDWSNVAAGRYRLEVVPADTTVCNSADLGEVAVYNTAKNQLPDDIRLTVPQSVFDNVTADYVEVVVGVGRPAYVYTMSSGDKGLAAASQFCEAGFHTLRLPVDSRASQQAAVVMVADGTAYEQRIRINRASRDTALRLRGESWRDKLTPGHGEQWTLRLADKEGKGAEAALVATLFNSALTALTPNFSWPRISSMLSAPSKNIAEQYSSMSFGDMSFRMTDRRTVSYFGVESPAYLYMPSGIVRDYAMKLMASSNRMMARSAADMAVATEYDEAGVEETVAVDAEMAEMTAGAAAAPEPSPEEFSYRAAETLQAFWMPALQTNADGETVIRFTMPNALGKWQFSATAWTRDMRAAEMAATLVSSKPVMAEPSLPRFLRRGDQARVGATVINNTDSAALVTAVVEIFNGADGTVISSETFATHLEANSQTVVYVDVQAPVGAESVGYRIKATNGAFTDGEQSLIPVLEASTVAVDSDLFYLDSSQTTFTTTIPADISGKGIVAIEYCQNPVWDAVKTLPGLYQGSPVTALDAAGAVYAALTARSMREKYPEITQVLDIWKGTPADSALVSDLYTNDDLKLAALAQTPFVGAANAATEQMERFAATFDKKIIDRVASGACAKLEALQRADGGFAWGSWAAESAVWPTRMVLGIIGQLYDKDQLQREKGLAAVIDRAFGYLDRKASGKTADMEYALLYSQFPGRKPSTQAGVQTIDLTKQSIVKGWKKHNAWQKAQDALVLNSLGSEAMARQIMKSVAQFTQVAPRRGVEFPSVTSVDRYAVLMQAFGELEPESPLLDGMRKWIVLRTQTTDDLGAWNPTALVAALLATGADWTSNPSSVTANVSVDGRALPLDKVEAATGAFCQRLSPSASPRAITFTCPPSTAAAYGSVTSISEVPLDKVEPRGCDLVNVTKVVKSERDGEWVPVDTLDFGTRCRVEITVEVKGAIDYVMISDQRPAGIEPVGQMPGWIGIGGAMAYREVNDTATNLFAMSLQPGIYRISYEAVAAYAGTFASGTATFQSQYAPEVTARSGAQRIVVR